MTTLYRVKLADDQGYISGGSLQSTKDRWLALTRSKDLAIRNLSYVDGGTLETVQLGSMSTCKVGGLRFNPDDSYGFTSNDAVIIHDTTKYVYTMQLGNGNIEKHKKSDVNTRNFHTGKGIRYAQN